MGDSPVAPAHHPQGVLAGALEELAVGSNCRQTAALRFLVPTVPGRPVGGTALRDLFETGVAEQVLRRDGAECHGAQDAESRAGAALGWGHGGLPFVGFADRRLGGGTCSPPSCLAIRQL